MKISTFLILGILAALLLDFFYWAVMRKRWTLIKNEFGRFLEKHLHVTSKALLAPPDPKPHKKLNRSRLLTAVEIILILAFALWVGREYLDFDEAVWPTGYEFGTSIRTHYYWIKFEECGLCFLWDGSIKGGAPSMVDLRGSWLHPLVGISTILFGVINGSKAVILVCLFLAGLAQWWIARQLNAGVIPRLYTASLAIVAGNLAASMNMGDIGRLLSHVSAVLALGAGTQFVNHCCKRNAILFSLFTVLLIISGQGYNQAGFFLAIFPSLIVLIKTNVWKEKSLFINYVLAGSLIILVTGFFLVPLFHFLPQLYKDIDPNFNAAQPIQYIPINLIIDNYKYYSQEIFGMLPYLSLYSIYIGWIPILLALTSFVFLRKDNWRIYAFFGLSTVLVLLASSGITFKALSIITKMSYGFRHPSVISGLLVPLVLGMVSFGLDRILKMNFLNPKFQLPNMLRNKKININLTFIILLAPLILSIRSAYLLGHPWFSTSRFPENESTFLKNVELDHTEWIKIPYGTHFWVIPLLENNLKVGEAFRDWSWKEKIDPPPFLEIDDQMNITYHYENEYASILFAGESIPCIAHANAGTIKIHCNSASGGILTVMENYWPGWKVWADEKPVELSTDQQWLTLYAEPGEHDYVFRFLPADVLIGFILTLLGIGLAVFMLVKRELH